jgi:hypothetical protein
MCRDSGCAMEAVEKRVIGKVMWRHHSSRREEKAGRINIMRTIEIQAGWLT